jgi:hypothetical protein
LRWCFPTEIDHHNYRPIFIVLSHLVVAVKQQTMELAALKVSHYEHQFKFGPLLRINPLCRLKKAI